MPELEPNEQKILDFLKNGASSAGGVCIGIGQDYPGRLENVRNHLNYLVRRGLVKKSVRLARETRDTYYSLPSQPRGGSHE